MLTREEINGLKEKLSKREFDAILSFRQENSSKYFYDEELFYYEGKANFHLKKYVAAIACFNLVKNSHFNTAQQFIAECHLCLKQYKEALQKYEVISDNDLTASSFKNKAYVLSKLNERDKAIKVYEKLVALKEPLQLNNKILGEVYYNLGLLYKQVKNNQLAKECFDNAYFCDRNNSLALINKALTYAHEKKYEAAQKALDILPALSSDHKSFAYYSLIKAYLLSKRKLSAEANEIYETILRNSSQIEKIASGNIFIIYACIQLKKWEKAKEYLEKFKDSLSSNNYYLYLSGVFSKKRRDFNNASLCFKKVLELNPNYQDPITLMPLDEILIAVNNKLAKAKTPTKPKQPINLFVPSHSGCLEFKQFQPTVFPENLLVNNIKEKLSTEKANSKNATIPSFLKELALTNAKNNANNSVEPPAKKPKWTSKNPPSQPNNEDKLHEIGRYGEFIAFEKLKSEYEERLGVKGQDSEDGLSFIIKSTELMIKITWHNKKIPLYTEKGEHRDSGKSCDIVITETFKNKAEITYFYEVKATTNPYHSIAEFSDNQVEMMKRHKEKYILFRVYGVGENNPTYRKIPDPFEKFFGETSRHEKSIGSVYEITFNA